MILASIDAAACHQIYIKIVIFAAWSFFQKIRGLFDQILGKNRTFADVYFLPWSLPTSCLKNQGFLPQLSKNICENGPFFNIAQIGQMLGMRLAADLSNAAQKYLFLNKSKSMVFLDCQDFLNRLNHIIF